MRALTVDHVGDALALAVEAARAGGEILRESYRQVQSIRYKGEIDLVTEVDLRAERAITELIRARYPSHRILAEEGTIGGDDADHRWLIDPLDGTTNYAHGIPIFCTSVGYELEGQIVAGAVYHPTLDELFVARRGNGASLNGRPLQVASTVALKRSVVATGLPYDRDLIAGALSRFAVLSTRTQAVRRVGSAALDLCWVAAGRFDGYWERVVQAWDVAAGSLIVTEAGGRLSTLDGAPFHVEAGSVIASAPGIYDELFAALVSA